MNAKWEGPFIFEPPKGDLSKDRFVWIKYQNPLTGKLERFRYNIGLNKFTTKEDRRQHGKSLRVVSDNLLKEDWSPFEKHDAFARHKDKSVVSLIDQYLDEIKSNLRPNTYKKYYIEVQFFKKYLISNYLVNLLLNDVTKTVVVNFLNWGKQKRAWKAKTYNHYLNDITTMFNYYHQNYDNYIGKVPALSLKRAPSERPGNSAFSDWQFKKLRESMFRNGDTMLYTFCSFIYYGALRNEAEGNYLKPVTLISA
ncbi:phage integrase SAM-like domain-containing protein [Arcticibacter eurypsychrophilus]|uniref:phage integrase SAM-like domain-containing protein n=1 Tax=Arcticibacter eurypsychrophilus TaxID=1434752 RepID=UPI00084DA0AA|nr:phage integrase SAM-like domain-containing protein [Arcticibacter eurypsychrophilus]